MPASIAAQSVAEAHPLKQGLKPYTLDYLTAMTKGVAEAHPLKQGLKQVSKTHINKITRGCRGTSTKTRIETQMLQQASQKIHHVAEAHPLKQGLKLMRRWWAAISRYVAEAHPLKQGLKHSLLE